MKKAFGVPLYAIETAGSCAGAACLWLLSSRLPPEPPWAGILLAASVGGGLIGALSSGVSGGGGAWLWIARSAMALAALSGLLFLGLLFAPGRVPPRASAGEIGAPAATSLRVLSFNVLHGYPRFVDQEARYRALAGALDHLQPDLVFLQEAWCTRRHGCLVDRLVADQGWHAAYARANGSLGLIGFEEGPAVLSRWPLEGVRRVALPRERWWRCRTAVAAEVVIDGVRWTVASTHLANRGEEGRARQARALAAGLPAAGPLVVGGDLNAGPGSAPVLALERVGLADLVAEAMEGDVPVGYRDIDHLLVRSLPGGWRLEGARWVLGDVWVNGSPLSDHEGLLARLERSPEEQRSSWP